MEQSFTFHKLIFKTSFKVEFQMTLITDISLKILCYLRDKTVKLNTVPFEKTLKQTLSSYQTIINSSSKLKIYLPLKAFGKSPQLWLSRQRHRRWLACVFWKGWEAVISPAIKDGQWKARWQWRQIYARLRWDCEAECVCWEIWRREREKGHRVGVCVCSRYSVLYIVRDSMFIVNWNAS